MFVLGILTEEARQQYYELYKLFALEHYQGGYATARYYVAAVFHQGFQGWLTFYKEHAQLIISNHVNNAAAVKPHNLLFYHRD